MNPLVIFLGAIGLTLVVTKSKLFAPLRAEFVQSRNVDVAFLGELISCSMCLGTWAGFVVGIRLGYAPADVLFCGGVVSVGSWFACGVCCALELLIEQLRGRKS